MTSACKTYHTINTSRNAIHRSRDAGLTRVYDVRRSTRDVTLSFRLEAVYMYKTLQSSARFRTYACLARHVDVPSERGSYSDTFEHCSEHLEHPKPSTLGWLHA